MHAAGAAGARFRPRRPGPGRAPNGERALHRRRAAVRTTAASRGRSGRAGAQREGEAWCRAPLGTLVGGQASVREGQTWLRPG